MMNPQEQRIDAVWQAVRQELGGKSYETAYGEFNTALLVDSNQQQTQAAYVVKVPHGNSLLDRQRVAYETNVIRRIHESQDTPPVEVPEVLGMSVNNDGPPWAAFSFIPGHALSYGNIRENLTKQELLDFGHKVGEVVLWLSSAISLEAYHRELNPPPAADREGMFCKVSKAVLSIGGNGYSDLIRMTMAELEDYRWFVQRGLLRPTTVGHDDIRPGNLAFKRSHGRWQFTGLFDFGMTAPSTPEREIRHTKLLGGFAAHSALGAYYGVKSPADDGPLIPGVDEFAETMVNFWAYAQALTNGVWRMRRARPVGSVSIKLDQLFAGLFDWSELESNSDISRAALASVLDSGG